MYITDKQLKKLGFNPSNRLFPARLASKSTTVELNKQILGRFRNICQAIFNSKNGRLDMDFVMQCTESSSPDVQAFFSNWLLKPVQPLPAFSTHEDALNYIIPKSAQDSQQIAPYLDKFSSIIKDEMVKSQNPPKPSE